MSTASAVVAPLFALVYGAVLTLALRRRFLARMAVREAVRRRGESLLVIGGLMIGTAAITASLVGADSTEDSGVANAYRSWGMVDLLVSAEGRFFPEEAATRLAADQQLGPFLDGVQPGIELVGSAADLNRRQGEPGVRIIGFDPATQRPFGPYVLTDGRRTYGEDLGEGEVLLSRLLAETLRARVGDGLVLSVEAAASPASARPVAPAPLRVVGIARSVGPGAYGLRTAVFAPLSTLEPVLGTELINVVRISAEGGLTSGVEGARRALPELRTAVDELGGNTPLGVREVKASEVRQAENNTEFTRVFLVWMSGLIVVAGATLVVNLTMMLAEERRPRLAVLRALGLTRRGLVTLSILEGAMYSLAAAAVGSAVGLLAGRVIAERFGEAFAQFFGGEVDFRFVFSVRPATLALSFLVGALITLTTVGLAAWRTSRMSIPAAIRDLPEPASERRRRWPRLLRMGLFALGGASLLFTRDKAGQLLGGILLVVAASDAVRPRLSARTHGTLTGLVLAGWAFGVGATLSDVSDPNRFFPAFTLAILASVFGLCILAAANLRVVEQGVAVLGGGSRMLRAVLRPPLAFLSRRPLRTGLTTGVFAVVLAIIALLAVFLSISRPRYERDSRGYDVRVTSTGTASLTLPADVAGHVRRAVSIPTRGYVGPFRSSFGSSESAFIPLFELDNELLADPPVRLPFVFDEFRDQEAVWRAMGDDPTWVISDFANPGERIVLRGPNGPVMFRVAANQQTGIISGVIGSEEALAAFEGTPLGVTMLVDTVSGADPEAVARDIERSLFSKGVNAEPTRKLLDNGYRANRTFFSVVEVLMQLGLVVGILSLGIVALRTVVERRRVIGVLRALGYRRRGVMAGLMAESALTATIGVVVGFAAGAFMGYLFLPQFAEGTPYGIDGGSIGTAFALVYGAVLVVTLGPAWRASRLPPAEAVRHSE